MNSSARQRFSAVHLALLIVLLVGFLLRYPFLGAELPYFYDEDEGHHYNRVVEMVKTGNFDPQYFRKPSLHFYLRMPVVAAAFLWTVRAGNIRKIGEIRTRDQFGLAQYAYTASHVGIVKWNRAFSLLLSLLIILFTFLLGKELFGSEVLALGSALIVALSPGLISDSAKVGVDTLMALTSLIAIYLAVRLYVRFSAKQLLLCGIAAGLAVSSKYNALPIVVLPLITCLLRREWGVVAILMALLSPLIGFLIGTPYSIVSAPLFLDQLGYEVWHYAVEGHVGNMAEPGWPQVVFFTKWFATQGCGYLATVLGAIGFAAFLARSTPQRLVFITFPLLYFLMMIDQRAHFPRNMLVMVPLLALAACEALRVLALLSRRSELLLASAVVLLAVQPVFQSVDQARATLFALPESRTRAALWLQTHDQILLDTAISGELLMSPEVYARPGVDRITQASIAPALLYLRGFDRIVVGPGFESPREESSAFLKLEERFSGANEKQRIVRDPMVSIYALKPPEDGDIGLRKYVENSAEYSIRFEAVNEGKELSCAPLLPSPGKAAEPHCWTEARFVKLLIDTGVLAGKTLREFEIEVMTPWPNQTFMLHIGTWHSENLLAGVQPGEWKRVNIAVPGDQPAKGALLFASTSQVHSPVTQKVSSDERRLGVALRRISLKFPA